MEYSITKLLSIIYIRLHVVHPDRALVISGNRRFESHLGLKEAPIEASGWNLHA